MNACKGFGGKTHRGFQLVIALQNVRLPFPLAKGLPVHESAHPGEVAVNRHRVIAAVNHAAQKRFAQTFRHVAATNGHIERAGIAVKVGEALRHPGKDMKIFRVKQSTLGTAMGGDHRHPALQRQSQNARIRKFGADDRQRVLAASVRQQRQFGFGHAFPKTGEPPISAIDVLAIRQAFHHYRA